MINEILHDGHEGGIGRRRALLFEHPERQPRFEMRNGQISAMDVEDRDERKNAGDMENRQRRPETILARHLVTAPAERTAVGNDRPMRDQTALRDGRRAGGVENERYIIGLDRRNAPVERGVVDPVAE